MKTRSFASWRQDFFTAKRITYIKWNAYVARYSVSLVLVDYLVLRFTTGGWHLGLGIVASLFAVLAIICQGFALFGPQIDRRSERKEYQARLGRVEQERIASNLAYYEKVQAEMAHDEAVRTFLNKHDLLYTGYKSSSVSGIMFLNTAGELVRMPFEEFEKFVTALGASGNYTQIPQAILLNHSDFNEPTVGSKYWYSIGPFYRVHDHRGHVLHVGDTLRTPDEESLEDHFKELLLTITAAHSVLEYARAYRLKTAANWAGQTAARAGRTNKHMMVIRQFLEDDSVDVFSLTHKPGFRLDLAEAVA